MRATEKVAELLGLSPEELATDAEETPRREKAVAELEAGRARGDRHLSIRLSRAGYERLAAAAERAGLTVSAYARSLLDAGLEEDSRALLSARLQEIQAQLSAMHEELRRIEPPGT